MRINNIGANTTFGRVIKLNAPPQKVEFSADDRNFGVLYELENVLNSRGSGVYTRNESNKIREFFKNILGDYSGKNGIMIEKAFGDTVIISGDDAKKVKELEEQYGLSYSHISRKTKRHGKNGNKDSVKAKNARVLIAKEIEQRSENGLLGKPNSQIDFFFKTAKSGKKANFVDCSKFGKFEYTSMHYIGSGRKMDDVPKLRAHTVFRSISYEENNLNL